MAMTPAAPDIATERLVLRGWREDDLAAYAAMLADPETARFVTRSGRPYRRAEAWAEVAFLIGHWQLLGHGMFVVQSRATGAFLGRVGTLQPVDWPGLEIAWALAPDARGNGYAVEAASAAIDWIFQRFAPERIISIIDPRNGASRRVAERLGERRTGALFTPFRDPCEIWAMDRREWAVREKPPSGPMA